MATNRGKNSSQYNQGNLWSEDFIPMNETEFRTRFESIDKNLLTLAEKIKELLDKFNAPKKGSKAQEILEQLENLSAKIDSLPKFQEKNPVSNDIPQDEKIIEELAEYGEKIMHLLAIAARCYSRKLPELKKHQEDIKNINDAKEKEKIQAEKKAEERGRKAVIKDLLNLYSDIHNHSVLATFLENQGVEKRYEINEELEIIENNIRELETYIAELQIGKIIITAPAYIFDGEVIARATYKFAQEDSTAQNSQEDSAAPKEV
ncbi:MAG: hypothetical protein IJT73_00345 [Selenomonadaceae bacterium]|nr:hypothetical protein [Selenomonadaceae bacterium]